MENIFVTNISKIIVQLSDLDIVLYPGKTINLLHKKNGLTKEQVEISKKSGSIYKKRDKLLITEKIPIINEPTQILIAENSVSTTNFIKEDLKEIPSLLGFDDQNISDSKYVDEQLEAEEELLKLKKK